MAGVFLHVGKIENNLSIDKNMFTRAELKERAADYSNAVKEREITIFTRYIADGIVTYSGKGLEAIKFPVLDKFDSIEHNSNGILNKYDPGPVPLIYIDEVVKRLRILFPDTDFAYNKDFLIVHWG